MVVISCTPFPIFLKYRDHRWDLPGIWKARQFLKSWATLHESVGSQLFRTTTQIQSGLDVFDEASFVMTFLTILGVTVILCSSKKDNGYRDTWVFKIRVLGNNFALLDAEDNISGSMNRGSATGLPVLRTLSAVLQKSQKTSFWEVIDSFVLLANARFSALRTRFAKVTSLSELFFRFRRWIMLVQTKSDLYELRQQCKQLKATEVCQAWPDAYNEGIDSMLSILTWTHSQASLPAAEAPSLKISSHGTSIKWSRRESESARVLS